MTIQKNFISMKMNKRIPFLRFIFLLFFLLQTLYCASSDRKEVSPSSPHSETTKLDEKRKDPSKSPVRPSIDKKKDKSEEAKGASGVTDGEALSEDDSKPTSNKQVEKSESGLKAGFADDNKQFNLFINFLEKFKTTAAHIDLNIKERITLTVKDKNGRSIPNADIVILADNKEIATGKTYADGTFLFFPSIYPEVFTFKAIVSKDTAKNDLTLDRQGSRNKEIILDITQSKENEIPLDVVFIMDTTGSMGEEIQRLKNTIEIINLNLAGESKNQVQFGMVLYRDKKEAYVTKVIPLTSDLEKFKKELNKVDAAGGGDYPEDLQSALRDSLKEIEWRKNAIRLSFIITDAPPHLDYKQDYTYVSAMKEARERGIKLFTIGTGGLDINGEYVLRQISQFTSAKYIFLTYGENKESEGGAAGSVSHHTGENFPTDKLESIVIRFAKEEIQAAKGKPLTSGDEYFSASKISTENKEETLNKLFDKAIAQLVDYSTFSIKPLTTVSVLPFAIEGKTSAKNGEYFAEQLLLGFIRNKTFKVVERKDLQKVLAEWKLNLQAVDEANAVKVGKLLGANLLVNSKLYKKDANYEIYIKFINTETGEIQSATKLLVDTKLGL
ncbi:MAG: VWA domain-containing protein [Leptospiraceae bacterium]|nr:VWA domain-containing protein [Leptospiraceae bacterium]